MTIPADLQDLTCLLAREHWCAQVHQARYLNQVYGPAHTNAVKARELAEQARRLVAAVCPPVAVAA